MLLQPRTSKLTGASTLAFLSLGLLAAAATAVLPVRAADSEDGFYQFLRPKLGYFARYEPSSVYARIYGEYFEHVIKRNDKAMEMLPTNDWRKVRPTGELCVDFLIGLEVKSFVMGKPYEVIMLDACVDWLLDDSDPIRADERAQDVARLDTTRKLSLKTLQASEKLRQIYQNTRFRDEKQVPKKLQEDIYAYVTRLLRVYSANPRNGCHSLWLEAYNDFIDEVYVADCEDETDCNFFGLPDSQQDSYLSMILESTRQASKTCYKVMQQQIHGLVESEFEQARSGPQSLKKRFRARRNRVEEQSEGEKWARELISILQMASGVSQQTPVNLGDVVQDLYKIKQGDQALIDRFTQALADYAKSNGDLKDSSNDQIGRVRFGRAMIKLCRPYTDIRRFLSMTGGINTDDDETERKPFEFYGLIYSLVRLTNHESLFDITKDAFEEDVIKNHWEALYLATFACQIVSTTWAELDYETNTEAFKVLLRPEWRVMVADWPLELMAERLPALYPSTAPGRVSKKLRKPSRSSSHSGGAIFGKKFKLNFLSGDDDDDDDKNNNNKAKETSTTTTPAPRALPFLNDGPPAPRDTPPPVLKPTYEPPPPQPPVQVLLPAQPPQPKVMSLETIEMFRKLHGRYPKLPDNIHQIYPQLPADLSGHYPRELGVASSSTTTPAPPAPFYMDEGRYAGQYMSSPAKRAGPKRDAISQLSSLNF